MGVVELGHWQNCLSQTSGTDVHKDKKIKEGKMLQTYMTSQILGFIAGS